MYKVTVTNPETKKIIRVRHFSTKKRAENYEDKQYKCNPVAFMFNFKIEKLEK